MSHLSCSWKKSAQCGWSVEWKRGKTRLYTKCPKNEPCSHGPPFVQQAISVQPARVYICQIVIIFFTIRRRRDRVCRRRAAIEKSGKVGLFWQLN
ncbi:hypothetical protein DdX_14960 [Ditylenchus destructor]|uniref:Uncharacterized protein n=1 Tax=Ditylenchus destructor TaxID=166010 RepID=A0AAD4MTL5_9BILA|nr:hypothetical protein DdX_14960 [Ditylenchus destructor]